MTMDERPEYYSESQKIYPKIEKYLKGLIVDIGCNQHKVVSHAIGIDHVSYPGVDYTTSDLDHLSEGVLKHLAGNCDVVYSSHCLEHFQADVAAVMDWLKLLREGGLLILYLPDDRYYNNDSNPEHVQRYTHEKFVQFMKSLQVEVVESGLDVGYDKYSFFIVVRKGNLHGTPPGNCL